MIISAMISALRGRKRWLKVKRKYGVEKKGIYLIVMPDDDREFNEIALKHIDDFLSYRKGSSAVILTTDDWTAQNSNNYSDKIIATERITRRDYYFYNSYFYYYGFSQYFIMMSLQGYYGKRLASAENVNGLSKKDLVCLGLYIIRSWTERETVNG